ncbi:SUF system Fe-S cluster assembly regulator [Granulibacter bethesdensis]|nr:SUF system Fe-S cluster assembly regulator [Granulibacter bethesdensis]
MFRLSKLTDYAVVVLMRLAGDAGAAAGQVQTAPYIAAATGVPEPTVAKVLKALSLGALVVSQRGAHGGYRLNRALDQISIADVIRVLEGPIALTACVEGASLDCEAACLCPMRGRWDMVNHAIATALSSISLADMARQPMGGAPLDTVLPPQPTQSSSSGYKTPACHEHVELSVAE